MLHAQTWEGTVRSQVLEAHASAGKSPLLQTLKERPLSGAR